MDMRADALGRVRWDDGASTPASNLSILLPYLATVHGRFAAFRANGQNHERLGRPGGRHAFLTESCYLGLHKDNNKYVNRPTRMDLSLFFIAAHRN